MSVLLTAFWWITFVGAEPPQPAAPQPLRSSQVAEFFVAFLARQLVQAADATNYLLAAGALGERPPDDAGDETGPEDLRMKADILDYLRGSFKALPASRNR